MEQRIRIFSVTNMLIMVNLACFLVFSKERALYFAFQPYALFNGVYGWTLISYMFIHRNWAHLLTNMTGLLILGNCCEEMIGRPRYLAFCIISGALAALAFALSARFFGSMEYSLARNVFGGEFDMMMGASGTVFALAGLIAVLEPRTEFMAFFFIPISGYTWVIFLVSISVVLFMWSGVMFAHMAHLGGFISGAAFGLYMRAVKGNESR